MRKLTFEFLKIKYYFCGILCNEILITVENEGKPAARVSLWSKVVCEALCVPRQPPPGHVALVTVDVQAYNWFSIKMFDPNYSNFE